MKTAMIAMVLVGLSLAGWAWGEQERVVEFNQLTELDNIFYLPGEDTPFTGKVSAQYPNGKRKYEGTLLDGRLTGKWMRWHDNGVKEEEFSFLAGEPEGKWTWWYKNCQKIVEGSFIAGKIEGKWISWYEDGQKEQEYNYQADDLHRNPVERYRKWYRNGQLEEVSEYLNGESEDFISWYENGQKKMEIWNLGAKDGKRISWYDNGSKESEREWRDGNFSVDTHWDKNGQIIEEVIPESTPPDDDDSSLTDIINEAMILGYFKNHPLDAQEFSNEFLAFWFIKSLLAMEEVPLCPVDMPSNYVAFRFLYLPSFDEPVVIRIESDGDKWIIATKKSVGQAGYYIGKLIIDNQAQLSESDVKQFKQHFDSLSFWDLLTDTGAYLSGLDGSVWLLEACVNGKYHVIWRWSPIGQFAPDWWARQSISNLGNTLSMVEFTESNRQIVTFVRKLLEMAKLDEGKDINLY